MYLAWLLAKQPPSSPAHSPTYTHVRNIAKAALAGINLRGGKGEQGGGWKSDATLSPPAPVGEESAWSVSSVWQPLNSNILAKFTPQNTTSQVGLQVRRLHQCLVRTSIKEQQKTMENRNKKNNVCYKLLQLFIIIYNILFICSII